ncbi:NifU family protein [Mycobacterium sp. pV006]|uniref:NifU family protein n=1 Tax=Mycobacterium sp. pV006 TaxID=3238983 RepID=UPI00351B86FE
MSPTPAVTAPPRDDARWRVAGDRIQSLLDAFAADGVVARERAEQLVREVTDLYGAALARMLDVAVAADPARADELVADNLVASLLLVHGLHPHPTEQRVAAALEGVRPYLGSHGGDVSLLSVTDGVVRLQFHGSCKSCPSSTVTLELAVQDAIRASAPEICDIELVAADPDPEAGVIPAEALLRRVHRHATTWQAAPELAELHDTEVGGFRVGQTTVLACRLGTEVFVYRDRCPACTGSLAGARLTGAVLRCPCCGAGFDVIHAGAGVGGDGHLEPVPVLEREGVLSMAIPAAAEVA